MLDTTKKYVMYLRKSRHDPDYEFQSVEETIKRHRVQLEAYAKKYNLNIVHIFREVVSGESIRERPEMMKMLDMISNEDIEGILCVDIDRLARGNSIDQGIISQTLHYTGTKVITPHKIYDPQNEFDEEYMEFGLFMSRKEYKIINRRLVQGRYQSASEGRFMGSRAPYGYKIVKLQGEKGNTLEIIPEQAEVVRMVFDLYCNQGYGYNRIANHLNDNEISSANGGDWTIQTVRQMLHNCVYAGYIRRGFKKVVKRLEDGVIQKHRVYDVNCDMFLGKHEAIVSKELFDNALSLGKINSKNKTNKRGEFHNIFSGLMYCSECGVKMKGANDTRELRPEYRHRMICTNKGCRQATTRMYELKKACRDVLSEWVVKYNISDPKKEKTTTKNDLISKVDSEIKKVLSQREKICELLEKEIYDIDTFKERDNAIQNKLAELREKKLSLEKELSDKKTTAEIAIPKIQSMLESWETMSAENKHKILKETVARISYTRPKGAPSAHLEFYPNF